MTIFFTGQTTVLGKDDDKLAFKAHRKSSKAHLTHCFSNYRTRTKSSVIIGFLSIFLELGLVFENYAIIIL